MLNFYLKQNSFGSDVCSAIDVSLFAVSFSMWTRTIFFLDWGEDETVEKVDDKMGGMGGDWWEGDEDRAGSSFCSFDSVFWLVCSK